MKREDIRQVSVNLRGVNLSGVNLQNATLRDTNLTGAFIAKADLSNADLRGSVFEGSHLIASSLRNANLMHTEFAKARFLQCDLSLAKFVASKLSSAFMWQCHLAGAHLYSADAKDTSIVASMPWEARLYWPQKTGSSALDPETCQIRHTADLLERCRHLRTSHSPTDTLYFRGEPRSSLAIESDIDAGAWSPPG